MLLRSLDNFAQVDVSAEFGATLIATGRWADSATFAVPVTPVTGNVTSATSTVACDVTKAANVVLHCTGTFSAVNVTFEASIDNGTTWFTVQAARSNANTVETTSGSLSAAPAYSWEISVNGYTHVRVRATAWTSGTQVWRFIPGLDAVDPTPAVASHAVTVTSGAITSTPATGTNYGLVTAATTNGASVKSTSGALFEATISNNTAAPIYVKLYNKTSAPTVGTDVPIVTFPVTNGTAVSHQFGAVGKRFSSGIAIAVTAAAAATDTAAVTAGAQISLTYI